MDLVAEASPSDRQGGRGRMTITPEVAQGIPLELRVPTFVSRLVKPLFDLH
jgi:hypothetical protein